MTTIIDTGESHEADNHDDAHELGEHDAKIDRHDTDIEDLKSRMGMVESTTAGHSEWIASAHSAAMDASATAESAEATAEAALHTAEDAAERADDAETAAETVADDADTGVSEIATDEPGPEPEKPAAKSEPKRRPRAFGRR